MTQRLDIWKACQRCFIQDALIVKIFLKRNISNETSGQISDDCVCICSLSHLSTTAAGFSSYCFFHMSWRMKSIHVSKRTPLLIQPLFEPNGYLFGTNRMWKCCACCWCLLSCSLCFSQRPPFLNHMKCGRRWSQVCVSEQDHFEQIKTTNSTSRNQDLPPILMLCWETQLLFLLPFKGDHKLQLAYCQCQTHTPYKSCMRSLWEEKKMERQVSLRIEPNLFSMGKNALCWFRRLQRHQHVWRSTICLSAE